MKYLLFAGEHYYPNGGWNDFRGSYDDLSKARSEGAGFDWYHVVDAETLEIIPSNAERVNALRELLWKRAWSCDATIFGKQRQRALLELRDELNEVVLYMERHGE